MNYDWSEVLDAALNTLGRTFSILCCSFEEQELLMTHLHEAGYTWRSGKALIEFYDPYGMYRIGEDGVVAILYTVCMADRQVNKSNFYDESRLPDVELCMSDLIQPAIDPAEIDIFLQFEQP